MKTSVEKEFAYDASIMVASQEITGECEEGLTVISCEATMMEASQELTGECEEGLTVVSSIRTLRR